MAKTFEVMKSKYRYWRLMFFIGCELICLIGLMALPIVLFAASNSQNFETIASQALLIDKQTDSILFEKQANIRIEPASLAKLMTTEVIFHALQTKKIALDDDYVISENAWRKGGAPSRTRTMFAAIKSKVSVHNLLQGLVVLQANDAAIALAEGSFNSEEAFVGEMNERANQIGLTSSHFVNSTGLPQEGQYTTLRDLLKLASYIEKQYPDYINLYSQPSFEWNKIFQYNRNPLLTANIGVAGFVNGFVEGQGYSIVSSVKHSNQQFFLALTGISKEKDRNEEAKRMIAWVVNAFAHYVVFDAGENIAQAKLFGGVRDHVVLKVKDEVAIAVLKKKLNQLEAKVSYDGPMVAPISANKQVGIVKILYDGEVVMQRPVFTAQDVAAAGVTQRAKNALYELSIGWLRSYWH